MAARKEDVMRFESTDDELEDGSQFNTVRSGRDLSPVTRTLASRSLKESVRDVPSPVPETARQAQTARTMIVMRHGERLDDLFGRWFDRAKAKGSANGYKPFDLNMPPTLTPLERPLVEYHNDTSLTAMGHVLAQMLGRALLVSGRPVDAVYCSPALRCVQTASVAASMCGREFSIRVEPGLFENTDLYPDKTPTFLTLQELCRAGFPIDLTYTPKYNVDELFAKPESNDYYNERVQSSLEYIAGLAVGGKGTVLVAAHASTVDLAYGVLHTRFANEARKTSKQLLWNIGDRIPYTANVVFMRSDHGAPWHFMRDAVPPATYRHFSSKLDIAFLERSS